MSFVCDNCLSTKYENVPTMARSYGPCEDCGKVETCSDYPSALLRLKALVTTDVIQALGVAWENFVTNYARKPAYIIMGTPAYLQAKVISGDVINYGTSAPDSYLGVPIVVSRQLPVAFELVGPAGSLHSLAYNGRG